MKTSPYQISAFTHAVREGSFSKAATVLKVTQSSVTQHVANLEEAMGVRLIIRRRDGLELTRPGRELFEISDRLTTFEQLIEEKMSRYNSLSEGHLRVVATAPRPALQIIQKFTAQNPGVQLEFSLYSWATCAQMLHERQVDIAIVTAPEKSKGLHMREVTKTRYGLFLRNEHRLAQRKSVSLKDISQEYIIVPEDGSLTQRIVKTKFLENKAELPRTLKTTTFPLVKEAILHGIGVGILLENTMYPSANISVVPIIEMPEYYSDQIVTHADKRELRLVERFLRVAEDLFPSM